MYLRKLKEKDAEPMLQWMHDANVVKRMGADFMKMTIDDCLHFISVANKDEGTNLHRAICSENNEYLGTISLKNISVKDSNAEYAVVLCTKAMGTGVAFDATKKILKLGFEELHLHKVYLCVKNSNIRARRFYEKVGFHEEGIFREQIKSDNGIYENLIWLAMLENEYKELLMK